MEFGIQFFPTLGPERKSGKTYFQECLDFSELCDGLGYAHVRTVEHHCHSYGGYSPNPLVFLSAAAQRTKKARLITGAVLPVFCNPLKLAGEIGMVDAISGGRLEVGFARAFLPHEFRRFGVSLDESRARFAEGLEQVTLLLEQENAASDGQFHSFPETTTLPRPTQRPHPPFWIAATNSPESFANAGKLGHSLMTIPLVGGKMREWQATYRDAFQAAGHKGKGRVMLAFHAFCWPDEQQARDYAQAPIEDYMRSLCEASSDWLGVSSKDYQGYSKIYDTLRAVTFDSLLQSGAIFVGTPSQVRDQIAAYQEASGGFDIASLQLLFGELPYDVASRSARLFAEEVMPAFVRK
jgi:alkanesulfonate monooxygenase SsuD/methylene tetrahydromethanopterin reductase-like flavin-dependent oxidoreductase (luciferase family)